MILNFTKETCIILQKENDLKSITDLGEVIRNHRFSTLEFRCPQKFKQLFSTEDSHKKN